MEACASVYGLMTNGSIAFLDYSCGRGVVAINYDVAKRYAEAWRNSLKAKGNNPDNIEPGIILLGTAMDKDAVYPFISGIPINTGLVAKGYTVSTKITINRAKSPKIDKTKIQQLVNQPQRFIGTTRIQTTAGMQEFPPRDIWEQCFPSPEPPLIVCYIWELKKIHYLGTNIGIPLSMIHLRGSSSPKEVYHVNNVLLHEHLAANSQLGIYVNFAGGAAVRLGAGTLESPSFKSDIFTYTLKGDNIYLDYVQPIYPVALKSLSREGFIAAIGFIGNYTISDYDYYVYIFGIPWPPGYIRFWLGNATLAIAVPTLANNKMKEWSKIDTDPTDGKGLDPIFNTVARNWVPVGNIESQTVVAFYSYVMVRQVGGTDLLALAIPIPVEGLPLMLPLVASVGLSRQDQLFTATDISVHLKSEFVNKSWIYANFYRTPVGYEWQGRSYYIPASYINVTVKGST